MTPVIIGEKYTVLTYLEKRILRILQEHPEWSTFKAWYGSASLARCGLDQARDAIFQIRKKESEIMGKLTTEQKQEIFKAHQSGTSGSDLAKQYGVTPASISQLIKKMKNAEPELEDCENGIPNTPLSPAEVNEKSANAKPFRLPQCVFDAIDDRLARILEMIDGLTKQRDKFQKMISDLDDDIAGYRDEYGKLEKFVSEYEAIEDAADVICYTDKDDADE